MSQATANLKEAGGKYGSLRTETAYKAGGDAGNVAKQTEALLLHGTSPA